MSYLRGIFGISSGWGGGYLMLTFLQNRIWNKLSCDFLAYSKKNDYLCALNSSEVEYFGFISAKVGVAAKQVAATVALLNENATIPFIARYRKEKTGSLDEVQIAAIADEYHRYLEIEDRKATILKTIEEQGKLTDDLKTRIEKSWDLTELEDI